MRMILDDDFQEWEVYASAGRHGLPEPGRLVFRCRSNPLLRPRVAEVEGDRARAERLLVESNDRELAEALGRAEEVA